MRSKSSGSHTFLLTTSRNLRMESDLGLSTDVKSTDTLGSVDLVATDRHQVDLAVIDINGKFSNSLRGISVEENFLGAAEFANLLNRLDGSNLIINVNDGHHKSIGSNCRLELL